MPEGDKVVIVHSLEQAVMALSAAAEVGKPIILQNAPGSLYYCGSLYLLHMFREACALVPEAHASYILDCADAAALAIGALRDGHRAIRLKAPPEMPAEMLAKLGDFTRAYHAALYTGEAASLDVRYVSDPKAAIRAWLLCD